MKHTTIVLLASIALVAPASLPVQAADDAAPSWSEQAGRLSESLKAKLADASARLDNLKAKIEARAEQASEEARIRLDELQKRVEQDRLKVKAAEGDMKVWIDARKDETAAKVAEWKTKRELNMLEHRAERAERYAVAMANAAFAAIDEAERAAIDAWLARRDANAAAAK
jgi:exonuclease VII large subunit